MKQTRRERMHEATREEIKTIAWQQIAEHGAAALSLRGIAREMGMTAPGLYRYFENHDALVTALIVEAFTSLGDALMDACEALPSQAHAGRLAAAGLAYREWALAYPQRYTLIFGTPIPGYQAPAQVTQPAAARSLGVLIGILEAARRAGGLPVPQGFLEAMPKLNNEIEAWRELVGSQAHPYCHYLALVIWSRVHGLVSLEIDQQYPPTLTDAGEIFRREIETIQQQSGLK